MRLKLVNFRCHANTEFVFPAQGLVLLAGSSGAGKSTILKAILYALFGNRAVRKPYAFGTTTCSVTCEWMGMVIQRTNRPNRLVVTCGETRLEDSPAQAFIDERLGMGYDEFLVSSYIPQKNNSSILSLSQTDQLRVIKVLAFEGERHEMYREKLKEMLRESSDVLVEKRAVEQFSGEELDRVCENVEAIDYPLTEADSISKYQRRMKNFNSKLSNLLETKATLEKQVGEYERDCVRLKELEENITSSNAEISRLKKREKELNKMVNKVPADIEKQRDALVDAIEQALIAENISRFKKQYTIIHAAEKKERKVLKRKIEEELWVDGSDNRREELVSLQEKLQQAQRYDKALEQLFKIRTEFDLSDQPLADLIEECSDALEQIEQAKQECYAQKEQLAIAAEKLLLEKEIVKCPECDTALRFKGRTLVPVHDHQPVPPKDYRAEIKTVEQQMAGLERKRSRTARILQRLQGVPVFEDLDENVGDLQEQVQVLEEYIAENERREKELQRLERAVEQSPALQRLQDQIDELEQQLVDTDADADTDIAGQPIDEIRQELYRVGTLLEQYQKNCQELEQVDADLAALEQKGQGYQTTVEKLSTQIEEFDLDAASAEMDTTKKSMSKLKRRQATDEELQPLVEAYLAYQERQKEIERWEDKYAEAEREVKEAELVHTAHLTLKEKYIQAEIIALESATHGINEHTKYYLDTFFPDDDLSAMLVATHKGKNLQTLKIDTAITYKGNEYDNINQLSGGEFDRCTLASICGINSLLGSPILILDESLSSLDTDTNTEILRFLQELAQDKLIIVCSHEAVRGIFDEIVEL